MLKIKSIDKKLLIGFAVCALLIFALSFLLVNTHDDYYIPEEGNSFSGSVEYSLTMGNGRYLGNFLGNYLPLRSTLNFLIRGLFLFGLVVLTPLVFGGLNRRSLALGMLLLVFPGKEIYAQAYQWAHGFYNYVPPIVFMLIALTLLIYSSESKYRILHIVILVFLGIVQSLLAENITVVCDFIALSVMVLALLKKSRKLSLAAAYLSGSLLGTAIMFIAPKIMGVASKMSWYRGTVNVFDISSLITCIGHNLLVICRVFCGFYVFWILLLILLFIKQLRSGTKISAVILTCLTALVAFICVANTKIEILDYLTPETTVLVAATISALLLAIVLFFMLYSKNCAQAITVPLLAAVISFGELLVVQPIGARCLTISYVMMSAVVLLLAKETFLDWPKQSLKTLTLISSFAALAVYCVLFVCQLNIYNANIIRTEHIISQLNEGKTEIEVVALPHAKLMHNAQSLEMLQFTYNYDNAKDISFVLISMEDYMNSHTK